MSTVKTDTVQAITTDGDLNLKPDGSGKVAADAITSIAANGNLALTGNGTGGVAVSDYLILTKGSDIASATALTLGKDGNAFDVTGTTTITSIVTQGIGSHVTLQFDGALTFTHHATDLILPGGANITTAAGDIAVMHEYASGDWRCVSYTKASGLATVVAAAAQGMTLISTTNVSAVSTIAVTGFDSTAYDSYLIVVNNVQRDTDGGVINILTSTNGGSSYDAGASDYTWLNATLFENASETLTADADDAEIQIIGTSANIGNVTGEHADFEIKIFKPETADYTGMTFQGLWRAQSAELQHVNGSGQRQAESDVDAVQFTWNANGFAAQGTILFYGITD